MSAGLGAAELDELLDALGVAPGGPDDALALGSLAVLQLVDLIEATSGVVLGSRQVTRATFATRASIRAMLAALDGPQAAAPPLTPGRS